MFSSLIFLFFGCFLLQCKSIPFSQDDFLEYKLYLDILGKYFCLEATRITQRTQRDTALNTQPFNIQPFNVHLALYCCFMNQIHNFPAKCKICVCFFFCCFFCFFLPCQFTMDNWAGLSGLGLQMMAKDIQLQTKLFA